MSQHRPATIATTPTFVQITLRRMRGRWPFEIRRGPMIMAQMGPRMNMTSGWRKSQ